MVCRRLGVPRAAYDPFAIERRLTALSKRRGIDFVPAIQALREVSDRGPFHLVPLDAHLNARGHERLAEVLADRLAAELGYPSR